MKKQAVLVAALCAATPALFTHDLFAQDDAKQKPTDAAQHQGMPDPKVKEHEPLKSLVGIFETTMKTESMPGVPGMEQPMESKGFERAELICDGLWLKSTLRGECMGQPFEGVWLVGYDPHEKRYQGLWIDNHESAPCPMQGSYDSASKTWTWSGKTPKGEMRSVQVLKDDGTQVETCYMTPPGSDKEAQFMQVTRKPAQGATPVEASAARGKAAGLSPEHQALQRDVGTWDAVVKVAAGPGQPASEEKGTERVQSVCGGKYLWSDFHGTMMGQPFEGHAIVGYDDASQQYVAYWIDSMSSGYARTTGSFDGDAKTLTMSGSCTDPTGQPMQMKETLTWKSDDEKVARFEFTSAQGTQKMEIVYRRNGGAPAAEPAGQAGKSAGKSGY